MFKKSLIFVLSFILILFSFIEYNKWKKPIENSGYSNFIEGNKLVKEKPQEALEQYKIAMEYNKDLNIKKNYEIANKQNQQQKKQEEQQKEKEKQDQEQQNQKSNKQDQSNNKNTKQDQNSEQQQPQQQKQGQDKETNEKYDQKKEELNSILQRLEGNEKQAFKNNEKILNSSENKDSENRW
ncbi:hypothetical protein H5J22_01065 [Cetobacterium sp. 8H]|uniref:hypothetical protein n=1 Tax=Cetobacterium sp. 8H TaxID=2759681 RepID=UPI00163CD468|nr:hypothetical protein [Cetobacterium sp. 8H]MBC2850052.1 hypothetical protein [Cetobacterium sp. 8H]